MTGCLVLLKIRSDASRRRQRPYGKLCVKTVGREDHTSEVWMQSLEIRKGFKILAHQIHPQTGMALMIAEAHNKTAVQKYTYAWTKCLGVMVLNTPGLSMRSKSRLRKGYSAEIIRVEPGWTYRGPIWYACSVPWRFPPSRPNQLAGDSYYIVQTISNVYWNPQLGCRR